jgi:hypothetical protein
MFSRAKTLWRMNEAAAIVENLLRLHSQSGIFQIDPKQCSTQWIAFVLHHKKDLLGGSFGQRPHKISVAAFALAHGVTEGPDSGIVALLALGTIVDQVTVNGALYPFNGIDRLLLEHADLVYLQGLSELGEHSVEFASNPEPATPVTTSAPKISKPTIEHQKVMSELQARIAAARAKAT